jgi:flagellar motility protein MotE (MotC chaperone)
MIKKLFQPRYFVLAMTALALVVLGVRLESLARGLFDGTASSSIAAAVAEDAPPKASLAAPPDEEKSAAEKPAKEKSAAASQDTHAGTADKPEGAEAKNNATESHAATSVPQDLSEGEMEVLKQLSSRRALLDERERSLQEKSAILQAAEMRVDQKVKAMDKLRGELQSMLGQLDEQQQTQIDNLVKTYEAMKPKEAARIMQTLELPVLMGMMRQMKPAKIAPILAEMDAPKAKEITMTLSKNHQLPDTKAAQ